MCQTLPKVINCHWLRPALLFLKVIGARKCLVTATPIHTTHKMAMNRARLSTAPVQHPVRITSSRVGCSCSPLSVKATAQIRQASVSSAGLPSASSVFEDVSRKLIVGLAAGVITVIAAGMPCIPDIVCIRQPPCHAGVHAKQACTSTHAEAGSLMEPQNARLPCPCGACGLHLAPATLSVVLARCGHVCSGAAQRRGCGPQAAAHL